MRNEIVTCNTCSKDLTATGNCEAFRLALNVERIPSAGGIVTLMAVSPPLDRDRHYCGVRCLVNDPTLRDMYTGASFAKPVASAHNTGPNT
jgi:hypothetical protein